MPAFQFFCYAQSGVTSLPRERSISRSLRIVEPEVVSMFPVMLALAPERKVSIP